MNGERRRTVTRERSNGALLVAGGADDPNVLALLDAARTRGLRTIPLLIGRDTAPALRWDLDDDALCLDGEPLDVIAAFARRDVFHEGDADADYRALTWYATLQGWLASSPTVRILNRGYLGRHTNKLHLLRMAREVGLAVPETIVTNDLAALAASRTPDAMVAKPVTGGAYCQPLNELMERTELRAGAAATPAIVQRRIPGADMRIYRVGARFIGFRITTGALDYRTTREHAIEAIDHLPDHLISRLATLTDRMGLDWGAADFKLGKDGDEPVFLEVNSDPMFSRFDRVAAGALCDAMLDALSARSPLPTNPL